MCDSQIVFSVCPEKVISNRGKGSYFVERGFRPFLYDKIRKMIKNDGNQKFPKPVDTEITHFLNGIGIFISSTWVLEIEFQLKNKNIFLSTHEHLMMQCYHYSAYTINPLSNGLIQLLHIKCIKQLFARTWKIGHNRRFFLVQQQSFIKLHLSSSISSYLMNLLSIKLRIIR